MEFTMHLQDNNFTTAIAKQYIELHTITLYTDFYRGMHTCILAMLYTLIHTITVDTAYQEHNFLFELQVIKRF